jgi:hypothetical protein
MDIGNADIHEAADAIGIGGDAERNRWLVGRFGASRRSALSSATSIGSFSLASIA